MWVQAFQPRQSEPRSSLGDEDWFPESTSDRVDAAAIADSQYKRRRSALILPKVRDPFPDSGLVDDVGQGRVSAKKRRGHIFRLFQLLHVLQIRFRVEMNSGSYIVPRRPAQWWFLYRK